MSVINTNIKALIAQNAATYNNRALSTAMQQLSTGSRINSAADDAAGLAISSRMTSQIRGLNQAIRNGNDAISLLQTAEGAMVEITNMLQRMRELSVQSATDTNTEFDRDYLNAEFTALKTEIDRLAKTTQWNGMNILDQSFDGNSDSTGDGTFTFQVGANGGADFRVEHTLGSLASRAAATGTASTALTTAPGAAAKQKSTITVGATDLLAGETIKLTINGTVFEYTVTAADAAGGDNFVATSLANALNTNTLGTQFTVAASTNTVTVEALANDTPFSISSTVLGKGLSVAGATAVDNIDTKSAAQTAITNLDSAIQNINERRADIGATINRLTYAVDNMTNVSQNASESRSRVLDTDYAKATTELARTQIIQQAATAMLAQANSQQQTVLALLQ